MKDFNYKEYIKEYIKKHNNVSNLLIKDQEIFLDVSLKILDVLNKNGTIFWCGNGGSMADASHLAAELLGKYEKERPPFKSIALGQDNGVLTCIANDYNFDQIFARELEGLANKNDFLILISTSGKSKNIIEAAKTANRIGMKSFALLGKDGGEVSKLISSNYIVPENKTSIIQEVHIIIGHIICEFVEFFKTKNSLNI